MTTPSVPPQPCWAPSPTSPLLHARRGWAVSAVSTGKHEPTVRDPGAESRTDVRLCWASPVSWGLWMGGQATPCPSPQDIPLERTHEGTLEGLTAPKSMARNGNLVKTVVYE